MFANEPYFDLVAVKNGEPDNMFDSTIEALVGMKKFVESNSNVVIKPNIGRDVPPERGGNTNPKLEWIYLINCILNAERDISTDGSSTG